MVASRRDQAWHAEWRNKAPQVEFSLPTDDALASAEKAMLDPDRNADDKKAAALRGVPQLVSSELTYSMWIPARDLTATFSDTEIMTSLGSDPQPAIWSANVSHLRDFKTIRNAGISFVCTDQAVASKLGGQTLSICGRTYRVQPYSKYSSWYYVDLQRLPDEVDDGEIYDWFAAHDTPPVFICPSRTIRGLKSRSRRVYFNQKSPPKSLMLAPTTPLREIKFGDHGYAVVNHRVRAFNHGIPPFLKAMREKRKPIPPSSGSADRTIQKASLKSDVDASAEAESTPMETSDAEYAPSEPNGSEGSESAGSAGSAMESVEDADSGIRIHRSTIWPSDEDPPKFPAGSLKRTDREPARILRAKQLVFGTVHTAKVEMRELPPSQTSYPVLASANQYEWLSEGDDGDVPPDQDMNLWDSTTAPPRAVASYVKLPKTAEEVLNNAVIKYPADTITLDDLCGVIESYLAEFSSASDADSSVYEIQAQPSVHRFLLDSSAPNNYQHLRSKTFGHAVLRMVSPKLGPSTQNYSLKNKLTELFPNVEDLDPQVVLQSLCSTPNEFWLQTRLAELDLALQVIAPSIYMDPIKVCALIQQEATPLPHPMWHLWDDRTLGMLVLSPLATRLLDGPLPDDLRQCIADLQQAASAVANSGSPSL